MTDIINSGKRLSLRGASFLRNHTSINDSVPFLVNIRKFSKSSIGLNFVINAAEYTFSVHDIRLQDKSVPLSSHEAYPADSTDRELLDLLDNKELIAWIPNRIVKNRLIDESLQVRP